MSDSEENETKETDTQKEKKEESKKANIITVTIDVDALQNPQNLPPVPENLSLWKTSKDISPEYQEFINTLGSMMIFIARTLNEGPEIKDNPTKRIVTIKTLLEMFLHNLNINGYMAYGLLTELTHDTYMQISGKQQTISLLKRIQRMGEKKSETKVRSYVS